MLRCVAIATKIQARVWIIGAVSALKTVLNILVRNSKVKSSSQSWRRPSEEYANTATSYIAICRKTKTPGWHLKYACYPQAQDDAYRGNKAALCLARCAVLKTTHVGKIQKELCNMGNALTG